MMKSETSKAAIEPLVLNKPGALAFSALLSCAFLLLSYIFITLIINWKLKSREA